MRGEPGFFDVDDRLRRLTDLGDQLEAFRRVVDFEVFRTYLDAALGYRSGSLVGHVSKAWPGATTRMPNTSPRSRSGSAWHRSSK